MKNKIFEKKTVKNYIGHWEEYYLFGKLIHTKLKGLYSCFHYCPVCGEMTEYTYIDSVSGEHSCGLGYAPNGEFCGECSNMSCDGCKVWEGMKNE